ncbi:MAG TPA: SpoIIE family protein phosphatase [Terriglobales bacterium]|nr:SpoIIE family protein phosphatase [Terriglobales bacterium]
MNSHLLQLRIWMEKHAVYPRSKLAVVTCYVLAIDVFLFALQQLSRALGRSFGASLGGWVTFLSAVVIAFLLVLLVRRISGGLLWRLRNRLIVTYIFIGVIPFILLVALFLGALYLLAGQFATFVATSRLDSAAAELRATADTLGRSVANDLGAGRTPLNSASPSALNTHISVWLNGSLLFNSPADQAAIENPKGVPSGFAGLAREKNRVFLRALSRVSTTKGQLSVVVSEPFGERVLSNVAPDAGEINIGELDQTGRLIPPLYSAGDVETARSFADMRIRFATHLETIEWSSGAKASDLGMGGGTRLSKLYDHLFAALGEVGAAMEVFLLVIAIVLGIFEGVAGYIGTQLTRTVTGSVAELYRATTFVNRGDFSHRIPITSKDQLAALAGSFNLMTESIQKLILEQKEKQRLQNEITIAQEVQNQLFPKQVAQLTNLEVHGFCRPARSVSGDYYDFLPVGSDRLILAVGDVSGKGISAALLMATIHSAVRAYAIEGIPIFRQAEAVVAAEMISAKYESVMQGAEVSPGTMLSLLNHQLYHSTPLEKYATLFLGMYDSDARRLIYSNAGHLPPLLLGEDGSCCRLERGGTVVGLFDEIAYDEETVQLRPGDIFLAYSDGVTEPENDFGEFGEERLISLVQENRDLPLARITEIVTSAVDDWIGAAEQPDDVTLVLARLR